MLCVVCGKESTGWAKVGLQLWVHETQCWWRYWSEHNNYMYFSTRTIVNLLFSPCIMWDVVLVQLIQQFPPDKTKKNKFIIRGEIPGAVIGRLCKYWERLLALESWSFYIIRKDEMPFSYFSAPAEDGVAYKRQSLRNLFR